MVRRTSRDNRPSSSVASRSRRRAASREAKGHCALVERFRHRTRSVTDLRAGMVGQKPQSFWTRSCVVHAAMASFRSWISVSIFFAPTIQPAERLRPSSGRDGAIRDAKTATESQAEKREEVVGEDADQHRHALACLEERRRMDMVTTSPNGRVRCAALHRKPHRRRPDLGSATLRRCHVAMQSRPKDVAAFIIAAATKSK